MTAVDQGRPHLVVRVAERRQVAADVISVVLSPVDDVELPAWRPGAHIDLVLGDGLVRQYSLCGPRSDRERYVIATRIESAGRGGSRAVAELVADQQIQISHPRNHFELVDASGYLFIAGGIGITPLLPMIEQVSATGAPWRLVYGGRSRSSMPFVEELMARHGGAGLGAGIQVWTDDTTGPIDVRSALAEVKPTEAVYCCGPEPLMAAVEQSLAVELRDVLHVERFRPRPTGAVLDREFEIELASTGRTLRVPADRSILEVLEDAGVSVGFSCREGTCGTCETKVFSGAIDHRDSVLSPAEREAGDYMMLCVSRAAGVRLVIDQ